jgi:hypothetical protein
MAENKLNRDVSTREFGERPTQWKQAELLPEPDNPEIMITSIISDPNLIEDSSF